MGMNRQRGSHQMMERGEQIFSGFNLMNFFCSKLLEVSGHFHPSAI